MSRCLLMLVCISMSPLFADDAAPPKAPDVGLGQRIARRIAQRRGELRDDRPVLRLIYFHPSDEPPLEDYVARWQRILDDVRSFYGDEMSRNGFAANTFDYEREPNGLPKFHVVRGRHPSSRYSYETGTEIREEARDAIGDRFDVDTSYILFVHGLCDEQDDGSYRIHAPYYGQGGANWQGGICHVADCPQLDVSLLSETEERIRYWEHNGAFDQSLAEFNTKYLGGVAHELGHGFGLPHNRERIAERRTLGTALMGLGNHTYRREVWSDQRGSFLTINSAVSLAIHPLFSGFDEQHAIRPSLTMDDGRFSRMAEPRTFEGTIKSDVEPLAAIIDADPAGNSNYDAQTSMAEIVDGQFEVPLDFDRLRDGAIRLRICLANGAVVPMWDAPLQTKRGSIDFASMIMQVFVSKIERMYFGGRREEAVRLAGEIAEEYRDAEQANFMRSVASRSERDPGGSLADVDGTSVSLAEVDWEVADVGWRKPVRNYYPGGNGDGADRFFSIDGRNYFRGLYAHAPSSYVYELDGKWKSFETTIGFQDGGRSEAVWVVIGDGEELMRSKPIEAGRHERRIVDVAGVQRLELVIESTRSSNARCWTVWADPILKR